MKDDWRMISTLGCAEYQCKGRNQSPVGLKVQCYFSP